jgi:hypothetical protein
MERAMEGFFNKLLHLLFPEGLIFGVLPIALVPIPFSGHSQSFDIAHPRLPCAAIGITEITGPSHS